MRPASRVEQVCSFDFSTTYGTHGTGFIEVHHVSPLHTLKPGSRTRLQDVAVLCANCHRIDPFQTQLADSFGIEGNASAPP